MKLGTQTAPDLSGNFFRGTLAHAAVWAVVVVGWVGAPVARGDGFRNPVDGAEALGSVGGRIVHIDDATAVSHNPANLVDIKKPVVLGACTVGYAEKKFTGLDGVSTTSEDPWRALPSAYGVWPLVENEWAAGVGVNFPFGQSTRWKKTSIPGMAGPYFAEMKTVNINPTLACRPLSWLSVGVGVDLYRSDLDFRQQVPWFMVTGNPMSGVGIEKFQGDGYGVGANAAVSVDVAKGHRVAVTYRTPFKVKYDGDLDISGVPPASALPPPLRGISAESDADTEFKFPGILGLGYGIEVTDRVRVEFNAEWLQHSVYDALTVNAGNNNALVMASMGSTTIPQDWKDAWTFGAGADWRFATDWIARAGYSFMQTPVPSRTLMPTVSEEDMGVASVGLGYRKNGHAVDVAFMDGIFDTRKVRDNQNPAFNGDYDFVSRLVGVSYSYSF